MAGEREGPTRVAVVGAGVAGLASALFLRDFGRAAGREPEIDIFEAETHHGGATRTTLEEGYLCEWGPNGFLDNEPATLDLVRRAGLEGGLVKADDSSANRYIYHGGVMRRVPTRPLAFLASDILPLSAKLRMAMEPFIPARRSGDRETVREFGERRLGRTFARLMLDPMVSGIFAGDIDTLCLESVFPKMVALERDHGGLFRALLAKKREARRRGKESGGPAGPNATLHTFQGGMGALTDRLAELFAGSLHTNRPTRQVRPHPEGGFTVAGEGWSHRADSVILALPSWAAAPLVAELSRETETALRDIWHAPVDVVCHGHRRDDLGHPLNGFGVLIPRREGVRALGTLWSDAIFPGQAPPGRRLLRTILGGAHDPEIVRLSPAELHESAHRAHRRVMDIRGEPSFRRVFRHERGIAQYNRGHLERVAATEALEKDLPGLYFTGASYRGVSVNGCAKDARRIAGLLFPPGE